MPQDPFRIPVIVGVGEVNDRLTDGAAPLDSVALMLGALAAAESDAGGGWLERCERILVVPQLSFSELDVPGALSDALGLNRAAVHVADVPSGDTPVRLLNDAANAIGAGEAAACAIVGAEAMRTALRAGKPLFPNAAKSASPLRRRYGLLQPAEVYPLYENALRAAEGQSLAEGQAETGEIWSLMSEVAESSQGAWLRKSRTPADIIEPSADNRPIAFPFTKLMVANASVNQGAAVIVTSLGAARAAGVPDERLVHIGAGAAAHEAHDAMARATWTTPPGMQVAISRDPVAQWPDRRGYRSCRTVLVLSLRAQDGAARTGLAGGATGHGARRPDVWRRPGGELHDPRHRGDGPQAAQRRAHRVPVRQRRILRAQPLHRAVAGCAARRCVPAGL